MEINVGDYFVCKRKSGFGSVVRVLEAGPASVRVETVSSPRKAQRFVAADTLRRNYRPATPEEVPA